MDYKYFYILLGLIWLVVWAILFAIRKDTRHSMLIISLLFGFGGILSEFLYIRDWWRPLTITNTKIGIEDFIFGFSVAGIISILYEEIYHKRFRKIQRRGNTSFIFYLFLVLFFGGALVLNLNTFYASLLAFGLGATIILIKRRDLIQDSIISGLFLTIIGIIIYNIIKPLFPDFIGRFWNINNDWFNSLIIGIPLKEYIWFFVTGMFIAPLYPFWKKIRLTQYSLTKTRISE